MTLQRYNPTTPGRRTLIRVKYKDENLSKNPPIKVLTKIKNKTGGRNNAGRTTSFHRGGGHKQTYRIIDFKRKIFDIPAVVIRLEYDPNRSSFIGLIVYENGIISYILAPQDLKVGDKIISSWDSFIDIKVGNTLRLRNVPLGTTLHNVELYPNCGGQLARAAGTSVKLIKKNDKKAAIRLISGKIIDLSLDCLGTVGIVSNIDNKNKSIGKAGYTRHLGIRPTVRGVAMNPIDHPHGGGEGKTSGGRVSVTPWGKPTKGYKTRRKK